MTIKRFVFNLFGENTYIISENGKAIIIDPGMNSQHECEEVDNYLKENNLTLVRMLNTHMHVDHTCGIGHIIKKYELPIECNIEDEYLAKQTIGQSQAFGLPYQGDNYKIENNLCDGDELPFEGITIKILAVPGHTKGHIAIYLQNPGCVFTGDSLFNMSIGRTDFPGGDFDTLIKSIETKLMTLPDNTIVYPGHGGQTTIGFEKANNPYLY